MWGLVKKYFQVNPMIIPLFQVVFSIYKRIPYYQTILYDDP